jgi:GNAT superfamily N-acetyltransferase
VGTRADYKALASFHYLRHEPFSIGRVLVLEDMRPTIAGRFTPQSQTRTPQSVVAVLIESLPALSCRLRDEALGDRYRWADRRVSARLLNAEVRCISRVVVHPQWRGLGLAVRLVKWALATAMTPYTEALAAMGRVHPFFELAGMAAYRRWPRATNQRLREAMRFAGVELWELASVERMSGNVERGTRNAELLRRELRRWAGGRLTVKEQLELARDRLLCEPVYYVQENRKAGQQESRK